ncbi:MAG: 30S ribosomal protein S17 [Phycisphaerae bacterium]
MNRPQSNQRRMQGVVVSDRSSKTITVRVSQRFPHPKYGKMVRRDRKVHAHDEAGEAHVGDTVEVVECRPMSRTKRWRLVRVIERNPEAGLSTEMQPKAFEQEAQQAGESVQ